MIGRPRKHESNAARQREYRLRQSQLRILLSVANPEPGSLPWRVQYAEAVRRIRAASEPKMTEPLPIRTEHEPNPDVTENPSLKPVTTESWLDDLRRACKEAVEAARREYEESTKGDHNAKDD
jgi:hypothetical protein